MTKPATVHLLIDEGGSLTCCGLSNWIGPGAWPSSLADVTCKKCLRRWRRNPWR